MVTTQEKMEAVLDTRKHISKVCVFLTRVAGELMERGFTHDISKMEEPELSLFAEWGPKLRELVYGSEEYKEAIAQMGVALQAHYQGNRHHPEHHESGVAGMNLVDLIEMVCDWAAAAQRTKDGKFSDSLKHNRERFGLSPQLVSILQNSAHLFEE